MASVGAAPCVFQGAGFEFCSCPLQILLAALGGRTFRSDIKELMNELGFSPW